MAVAVLPGSARAASVDWDNGSGDSNWNTPENWSTDEIPTAPDDAVFVDPAVGPANINEDIPQPRDIRFGDDDRPGVGIINHTAGDATLGGWMRLGIGGAGSGGVYNLSGTGAVTAGRYNIGESPGSEVTLAVSGGTLTQPDTDNAEPVWNRIGDQGTANFNITGGTVSLHARTMFGAAGDAVANVTQTDGLVETRVGDINIADTGTATYNISGGTLRKGGGGGDGFVVGQWTGGDGTLNVSGTANVISESRMIIGHGDPAAAANTAVGVVNQTGGTVTVADNLQIGLNSSANGTYNLAGGVLDLTGGDIEFGSGTGAFNMTGGELRNLGSTNRSFSQTGGIFRPGGEEGGIATSTITGDYTMGPGSTLLLDLADDGSSDVLNVLGTATLSGVLALDTPDDASLIPAGTEFTIVTPDDLTGQFANSSLLFADNDQIFTISYVGGDGNDVVITATNQVIPEPGVVSLLGLAVGAGLMRRRARRH